MVLQFKDYLNYFNFFASLDQEEVGEKIDESLLFLEDNIPLFDCPDKNIERTYYFRWWNYHKHIKKTDAGYIITEFLKPVSWALKYNAIAYPFYHQILDGRWLKNESYLNDYEAFWVKEGIGTWNVSGWKWPVPLCWAVYERALVKGNFEHAKELLLPMVSWCEDVDKIKLHSNGLMWSSDNGEGEVSISGGGFRPAMNSYTYANVVAIVRLAKASHNESLQKKYTYRAENLKHLINQHLWDSQDHFYKTIPLPEGGRREMPEVVGQHENILSDYNFSNITAQRNVREWSGFLPWCFHIPPDDALHSAAWAQIKSDQGFHAPYGLTTAEQRHPEFKIAYEGHMCQWNGPSWPFATSLMLRALGIYVRDYTSAILRREDFLEELQRYSSSHLCQLDDETVRPWIDENLDPYTGVWLAREIMKKRGWHQEDGGVERGKDYNHSHYIDLVISGLVGLRPRDDDTIEIDPLLPKGKWKYFCLDKVFYHGHCLSIMYDSDGLKYNKGDGFMVWVDNKLVAKEKDLCKVIIQCPLNKKGHVISRNSAVSAV